MRTNSPALPLLVAAAALAVAGCDVAREVSEAGHAGGLNCTVCHGTPTGDHDFAADPERAAPNDAHQVHLAGGAWSGGYACSSCHVVPTDLSHVDGQAPVVFSGLAVQGTANASYSAGTCTTYCHGAAITTPPPLSPPWTDTVISCVACHSVPPPGPLHDFPLAHASEPCASCHIGYAPGTAADPAMHVNGTKDVVFAKKNPATPGETYRHTTGWSDCAGCHTNNANHP